MTKIFSLTLFLVVLLCGPSSMAQDATFTYQGELNNNGIPANGIFSMTFALFDAEVGGNQVSLGVSISSVLVVDGKFTVGLDLGADAFDNSNRWLEIIVEGTTLSPRHLVTRAPYAIQTRGIFVDDNHNVGIGTVVPTEKVHVRGDAPTLRLDDDELPGSYLTLRDVSRSRAQLQKVNANGAVVLDLDPRPLNGTGDAELRLFRNTDTNGLKRVSFYRGNNSTTISAAVGLDGQDSYFQMQGGNFGIGTSAPNFLLHVNGDAGKPGGGSWSNASDVRLKKNIEPIDDALDTLLRLRGVTYEYIDPDAIHELPGQRIGMIAQEVEKVVPDWVDVRDDGYKTVTHRGFEALTVEAMRELREEKNSEVGSLRAENVALRTENDSIRARLESLENLVEQLASTQR